MIKQGDTKMTTFNTVEQAVEAINEGGYEIAAQYAVEAEQEAHHMSKDDYEEAYLESSISDRLEVHLDAIQECGAEFDYALALAEAVKLASK